MPATLLKRLAAVLFVLPILAACGGGSNDNSGLNQALAQAAAGPLQQIADQQAAQQAGTQQQQPASPPAPVISGDTLASFDVVRGDGSLIDSFHKTGPGTWEGIHFVTGQPTRYSANSDAVSLALYTDGPPIMTVIYYVDTNDISSSGLDPALRAAVTNRVFQ